MVDHTGKNAVSIKRIAKSSFDKKYNKMKNVD